MQHIITAVHRRYLFWTRLNCSESVNLWHNSIIDDDDLDEVLNSIDDNRSLRYRAVSPKLPINLPSLSDLDTLELLSVLRNETPDFQLKLNASDSDSRYQAPLNLLIQRKSKT